MLEHVEELVVLVVELVAVEDAGAAAGDEHRQVVHGLDGRPRLGVGLLDDAVQHVQGVLLRLVPPLRKARDHQVLPEHPEPELVHHEDLLLDAVALAIPGDHLVHVSHRGIDPVVGKLVKRATDVEAGDIVQVGIKEQRVPGRLLGGFVLLVYYSYGFAHLNSSLLGLMVQKWHLGQGQS